MLQGVHEFSSDIQTTSRQTEIKTKVTRPFSLNNFSFQLLLWKSAIFSFWFGAFTKKFNFFPGIFCSQFWCSIHLSWGPNRAQRLGQARGPGAAATWSYVLHLKSMYKIDRRGGGNNRSLGNYLFGPPSYQLCTWISCNTWIKLIMWPQARPPSLS